MIAPAFVRSVASTTLLALCAGPVVAVEFTVGAESGCTHTTVQAAFDAVPATGPHIVRIARTQTYTAQALRLASKRVTVIGGFDTCSDTTASGVTTLSGEGGSSDSVLTLTLTMTLLNNDVILQNLAIIRGDEVFDGFGGGIDFRGPGVLTLRNTSVSQNYAGYGGGINVSATHGPATLNIEAGSFVVNNIAQFSGGGIRLWGEPDLPARLFMLADNAQVSGNEALGIDPDNNQPLYGYGGGIELVGNADANIGSPGLTGNGAVFNNRARYGGGIAVMGEEVDGNLARIKLFTINPNRPGRINGNRASQAGGGIYLLRDGIQGAGVMCAHDFRIDHNRAQEGSAIYADYDDGTVLDLGTNVHINSSGGLVFCDSQRPGALGAVPCAPGVVCNSIDANIAETSAGQATTGATVLIQKDSKLHADRVQLRNNSGGQALRLTHDEGGGDDGVLSNCLFADNLVSGHLILADDGADLALDHCTLANNSIAAAQVIEASDFLTVRRSIIDQPGKVSQAGASSLTAELVVATEIASLGGEQLGWVVLERPRFIDAAGGDYRQLAASRGVDFAFSAAGLDLDLLNRRVDLEFVPDWINAVDLGPYERQSLLPIPRNHGFATDLRLWTVVTPGSSTWVAAGANSAGAAYVSQTAPPGGQVVGLRQCIHLPGPGTYALNAFALSPGIGINRDRPILAWRYRANAADCTGAPTVEGELPLPRSGVFTAAASPAIFQAPAGQWTRNSTLELSLIVVDGDATGTNAVDAYFDGITLEPVLGDLIFSNGFEQ